MPNDITDFWVVTRPTKHSTLDDILFCTDIKGMMIQALGGLNPEDVLYTTKDQHAARKWAQKQLELRYLDNQLENKGK